jgi:hypothetical protein
MRSVRSARGLSCCWCSASSPDTRLRCFAAAARQAPSDSSQVGLPAEARRRRCGLPSRSSRRRCGLPSRSSPKASEGWRRGRDSNPWYPSGYSGFQDHRHRPLGHPSDSNCGLRTANCELRTAENSVRRFSASGSVPSLPYIVAEPPARPQTRPSAGNSPESQSASGRRPGPIRSACARTPPCRCRPAGT